jgi:hypothetical protein
MPVIAKEKTLEVEEYVIADRGSSRLLLNDPYL